MATTPIDSAYERFCVERFPLPTEKQVRELEERIEVRFSDDYRDFLRRYNGGWFKCPEITPVGDGCPQETLRALNGIGASHPSAELGSELDLSLFDDNSPPKILPIGHTGMGGLIILDTAPGDGQGAIFLKQAYGDFYYLTDGIEDFLALLREPTWL